MKNSPLQPHSHRDTMSGFGVGVDAVVERFVFVAEVQHHFGRNAFGGDDAVFFGIVKTLLEAVFFDEIPFGVSG